MARWDADEEQPKAAIYTAIVYIRHVTIAALLVLMEAAKVSFANSSIVSFAHFQRREGGGW